MKRLVSGIQPTGIPHIGNYLGALKQWVALEQEYDCFYFIADDHALTARPSAKELHQQTLELAAMIIAVGVDPTQSTLFVQSQVPEHTELAWLLTSLTSVGALNRMTQFKEKSGRHNQNAGLLTYPILMAADVLIYGAEVVPVGDDQRQHLELARELARTFNNSYEKLLVEPKPLLTDGARIMSLKDPAKKMSKSVPGSFVSLLDSEADIEQKIRRAVTDSDPNSNTPGPGVANLLTILAGFSSPNTVKHFAAQQQAGTLRYSELKEQIIEDLVAWLRPIQKTYHSLMKDPDNLVKTLRRGSDAARPVAQKMVTAVKKAVGLVG